MATYKVIGDVTLRFKEKETLSGKQLEVKRGDTFEHEFSEADEARFLKQKAIEKVA